MSLLEQIEQELNDEILKSITPQWFTVNWNNTSTIEEIATELSNIFNKVKDSEPNCMVVDEEGRLVTLYGDTTERDYIRWYVPYFTDKYPGVFPIRYNPRTTGPKQYTVIYFEDDREQRYKQYDGTTTNTL